MEKTTQLKMLLESSLKRIFQATVTDILVSVEQTLSEYQGTIQTIQTENEGLKRLLSAQRSAESLHEDGSKEDATEELSGSDWNNHPINSIHAFFKVSKCSNDKTCFRKKNEGNPKKNTSSPPLSLQTDQLEEESCVDKSSAISVSVKTEPNLEESAVVDLCQPSLNQTVKLEKNESLEVTDAAFTDVHLPNPKGECRESDHSVKVTIVSKGYTEEGHFIKIEEEEDETLPGSEGDSLSQSEVNYALKFQEAELDQRWLKEESTQDVTQEEGTLHHNNSSVAAEEDAQEQSSNFLRCPTCPKTFSKAASLSAHIKSHSKSKDHSCNVCGKSFRWAHQLISHQHTHTGEKPYGCNLCSKAYANSSVLRAHQRTHTGEKPYICQQCGKTFRDTGNLQQHVRIHTGERPHSCTQCGRSFSCLSHLKAHSRIHTGEKPYACKLCRKTFSQTGTLKVHMRRHTGERPYSCKECGKKFPWSSSLKQHLKSHM
ncbi:uncharacterized protein V3H82_026222 [Fundulus diaphanus]